MMELFRDPDEDTETDETTTDENSLHLIRHAYLP